MSLAMREACPISNQQVNEKAARLNALIVLAALISFLWTKAPWIVLLLGIDFFLRGFSKPSFSFISAISCKLLVVLASKPRLVNAGPKIFAAKIGFIFCSLIFLSQVFGFYALATSLAGLMVFFAFLESFFGYCVACKIYSLRISG